jgi:hypothetical protein
MRVGEMRAFITVAWCLAQLQQWHGPFYAYFKRLYPQLAPRLQARDTLRVVTLNAALRLLSPFPNLALGQFDVGAASEGDVEPGAGQEAGLPASAPSERVDASAHAQVAPRALPVKREGTVEAVRDPLGIRQPAYIPGVRRSDLAQHKALLAAVRQRWGAAVAHAGSPAPHGDAVALLGTSVTEEGLLLDFCVPTLRIAGKLVAAANFTPDTQQLDAGTQLEAALAHAAGWRVIHVAAFGADAASVDAEAQRAVDEMAALLPGIARTPGEAPEHLPGGEDGSEAASTGDVSPGTLPTAAAPPPGWKVESADAPAHRPALPSPEAQLPEDDGPRPAVAVLAPVAAPAKPLSGSVSRALRQRGFVLQA